MRCPIFHWLLATAIFCLAVGALACAQSESAAEGAIALRSECPKSFVLDADGRCALDHWYYAYGRYPMFHAVHRDLPPLRSGTPQQIDLGRYLFFDPLLSGDGSLSCAHCHHPDHSLADGRGRSMGVGGSGVGPGRSGGTLLPRGAPTLWNVGFFDVFFLDGRAPSLTEQAQGPLFSPIEMANSPERLEASLNGRPSYRRLFREAFELDANDPITTELITRALASFEKTLISLDSPYDRYVRGDTSAMSSAAIKGFLQFHAVGIRFCVECHPPPLFTNGDLTVIGAPDVEGQPFDPGSEAVTGDPKLRGAFRNAPLRNAALTAPYMHSGALEDLHAAVDFYNKPGGHRLPEGEQVKLHWLMANQWTPIVDRDIQNLAAFLEALTDESHMPDVPSAVPSGLPVVPTERNP